MAQYKFIPPSVYETPIAWDRLFVRYGIHRGVSVLMIDGRYSSYRFPAQTDIAASTEHYLGGHVYIIDENTKTRLTDASIGGTYGDNITAI
jgi:hypothetical protein